MNVSTGISELLCQAEVDKMENIGRVTTRPTPEQNIFRFDIAMNDVSGVNKFQMKKLVFKGQENKYYRNE